MNTVTAKSDKIAASFKLDRTVKEQAQVIAKDMGLPLGTLVNAYLKQFIRTKEVHITLPSTLNSETDGRLRAAVADLQAGKNVSTSFSDSSRAVEALRSWK